MLIELKKKKKKKKKKDSFQKLFRLSIAYFFVISTFQKIYTLAFPHGILCEKEWEISTQDNSVGDNHSSQIYKNIKHQYVLLLQIDFIQISFKYWYYNTLNVLSLVNYYKLKWDSKFINK